MRVLSRVTAAAAALIGVTALGWGVRLLIRFHNGDPVVAQWWHMYAVGNGTLWVLAIVLAVIAMLAAKAGRSS